MNCHDIDTILDDGRIEHLTSQTRAGVDLHLAECERCTGVWSAQTLLANRPVPKLSSEMLNETRRYIANHDEVVEKRRPRLRWLPFAGVASAASLVTGVLVVAFVGMGSAQPAGSKFADRLPEFSLASIDGQPLSIGSWPGNPLIINFWATWCTPCRREIPLLIRFQSENQSVQVVGIAVDNADDVQEFDVEMQFNYPIMIGGDDAIEAATMFGIGSFAIPFTVFVDSEGYLLGIHYGEILDIQLESYSALIDDIESGDIDIETARSRFAEVR